MRNELEQLEQHPPPKSAEYEALLEELRKPYATSFWRQLVRCCSLFLSLSTLTDRHMLAQVLHTQRWILGYWRNPLDVFMTLGRGIFLGIVAGTVFWNRCVIFLLLRVSSM